MSVKLASVT